MIPVGFLPAKNLTHVPTRIERPFSLVVFAEFLHTEWRLIRDSESPASLRSLPFVLEQAKVVFIPKTVVEEEALA